VRRFRTKSPFCGPRRRKARLEARLNALLHCGRRRSRRGEELLAKEARAPHIEMVYLAQADFAEDPGAPCLEVTTPSVPHRPPSGPEPGPNLYCSCASGLCSHSQINRQGGTLDVERLDGRRCRRIELRYQWSCSGGGNDDESRPDESEIKLTHPCGGKTTGSPSLKAYEVASETSSDSVPSL